MALFDRSHRSTSYLSSIVTMAISCIISEIKRDIGQISRCFCNRFYITTSREDDCEYFHAFYNRARFPASQLCDVYTYGFCKSPLFTQLTAYRQTDRQTDGRIDRQNAKRSQYSTVVLTVVRVMIYRK